MLRIENLTVAYGGSAAVSGLDLTVADGEAVSMVGPNGAGKTSTLSAIVGQLKPASGTILFRDRSVVGEKPESLVRSGIALVPEGRQIFSTLTVGENLKLPVADLGKADAREAIDRELERFPDLSPRLANPAGGLSGGQQQMLAISRALLCRPKLLLLDEPSLGLAPKLVDVVFEALTRLREDGVTILLVEQNAIRASQFADRTYVLNAGKVVLQGSRSELADTDLLTESYLGSPDRAKGKGKA